MATGAGSVALGTTCPVPIGDYGLIGDTRTAALVAPDGTIDWCCLPRFDHAPTFGRLVGGDAAGSFALGPAEPVHALHRSYRPDTTVLETTWTLDGAELTLTDAMIADVAGRLLPNNVLVRHIAARGRPVQVAVRCAPRFGYGRRRAARTGRRGDALVFERGDLALALGTDAPLQLVPERRIEWELRPDRPATFVLTAASRSPLILVPPTMARAELARDQEAWAARAAHITEHLPYRDAVVRSLITLQLLTYSPSGAPVAAPTTSLPEQLGSDRNWDYRYAWPRDASIGVGAFLAVGRDEEARAFLSWLLHASRLARPRLPALFTLDGRPVPRERTLTEWPGYDGSRPVRTGNGAADQHQLDGYGWVLDAAWLATAHGQRLSSEMWRAVSGFADHVAATWRQPDSGIWERRSEPAHYVHSKLMAWLALDRALRIAETRQTRARRRTRWLTERDLVAESIRTEGFTPDRGTYTGAYGDDRLDAAVLLLPTLEFDPPDSPRLFGTIDAIRDELSAGGPLLYRYEPGHDGLAGGEGAFLPCSFWLVQALARTGRLVEAHELFRELLSIGGPLGLYAEELDPATGAALGNFPQALTHAAMVQAALALRDAEGDAAPPSPGSGVRRLHPS